jgi:flagellar basal-body rod modification protein FlgD
MPVDSIGSTLGATNVGLTQSTLNQDDFIKLFLTQLTFQDPLEPVDNREFLAQMAQFANLEQARVTNENTENLVIMNATSQSLGLLGRQVAVESGAGSVLGSVTSISFSSTGPLLTITKSDGAVLPNIRLSQISLVKQP